MKRLAIIVYLFAVLSCFPLRGISLHDSFYPFLQTGVGICMESNHTNWESYVGPLLELDLHAIKHIMRELSVLPRIGIKAGITGFQAYNPMLGIHAGCSIGYRYETFNTPMMVSLGPTLSYWMVPMRYHFSFGDENTLEGKSVYKRFTFSLRPEITVFSRNRWTWGFAGSIGLGNAVERYSDEETRKASLYSLQFIVGYRL